jgi:hypothetical protein
MVVNKGKSGIMEIPASPNSKRVELLFQREYWGYPVVQQYKYLGTVMDGSLGVSAHLTSIARKVTWLNARMTPVRNFKDLRLNINLYKVLIEPLVALGIPYYLRTSLTEQRKYATFANKAFKKFCVLPRSLPNEILDNLIEPADHRWRRKSERMWLGDRIRRRYWAEVFQDPNFQLFEPTKYKEGLPGMSRRDQIRVAVSEPDTLPQFARQPKPRYIPKGFVDLMWLLNTHKCKAHDTVCRRGHLLEDHSIRIPIGEWLQRYQTKREELRKSVDLELSALTGRIKTT